MGDLLLSQMLSDSLAGFEIIRIDFPTSDIISDEISVVTPDIKVFSARKQHTKLYSALSLRYKYLCRLLNKSDFEEKIKKLLYNVDGVVIGGGNMVMDIDWCPTYTYLFYEYTKIAKELNIPIYATSIGIGPFQTKIQKWYAKKGFKNCQMISVRDDNSKKICNNMGVDVTVCGDPAFFYNPTLTKTQKDGIAICLIKYECVNSFMSYNQYVSFCQRLIDGLKQNFIDEKIVIFSSEITDYSIINAIYEKYVSDEKVTVNQISSFDEIFDFYSSQKLIISFRMHSAIMSMLSGVPVIGIGWQSKVRSLFSMLGLEENIFNIDDMIEDKIVEQAKAIQSDDGFYLQKQMDFVNLQKKSFQNYMSKVNFELNNKI